MVSDYLYNERHQATYDTGIEYYLEQHAPDLLNDNFLNADYEVRDAIVEKYCEKHNTDISDIALSGLIAMINEDIIQSPAFIAWEDIPSFLNFSDDLRHREMALDGWIERINEPQKRVDMLNYWIQSADIIFPYDKKDAVTHLKAMLPKYKEAAKIRKQELDKEKAAQRKQTAKEKPEYVLSIEEIINYTEIENPESASTIRAMLRYFATEKPRWNNKTLLNRIRQIGQQVTVMGDVVQGNKIANNIESVSANGIGVQEIHE